MVLLSGRGVVVDKLRHREFIGFQVYMAQRALARSLDATLAPFGLTSGQWNMMNQLEEYGAMTQKDLAEPHGVAQADRIASGISDEDLAIFFDVLERVRANATKAGDTI